MDLWGPGWRHRREQGGQPCWLGHLYKATTEGTLLGDAVLKWLGAARLSTDLGAGLTRVIFQLGPCQVISASPCLWKPNCGTVWDQEGCWEAQSAKEWMPTAKCPVLGR